MKDREKQILNYLILNRSLISKKELAEHFNTSVSTIRDEINNINHFIEASSVQIISVRGAGVKLDGKEEAIYTLSEQINSIKQENLERCYYIAYYLLIYHDNYIRIKDLADRFYLSRSAIYYELKKLNKILKDENVYVELNKGKGVCLKGEEKVLRNLLSRILAMQTDILDPYGFKSSYQSIQENMISGCKLDVSFIYFQLKQTLEKIGLSLSDNSLNTLLLHIAISIIRIQQGNVIQDDENHCIRFETIYTEIRLFTQRLAEHYRISFIESEIYLIYQYVISSNDVLSGQEIYEDQSSRELCFTLAKDIVHLVEETRNIHLSNHNVMDNLIVHLLPLVNRTLNHVDLKNPLLEQIKQEYSDAFGIAWMCNSLFKKYFKKLLSEDELAYLAIHIEAMLEQEEPLIRTILVCSQGIGISQLIASKIQKAFHRIKIVDVIAEKELMNYQKDNIDLCISTFPVETSLNKIIVNPLLYQQDYKNIQNFIDDYSLTKIKLFNKLHLETLLHCKLSNQQDVIDTVSKQLFEKGYVFASYAQDVVERERKCSTAIGCKTALPHGYLSSVQHSALCIVTFDECILWGEERVDLLVFLAIKEEDVKIVNLKLRQLYQCLYQEEIHNLLVKAGSKKEIETILDI